MRSDCQQILEGNERKLLTFSESLWKLYIYVLSPSVAWAKDFLIIAEYFEVSVQFLACIEET